MTCAADGCTEPAVTRITYLESNESQSYCSRCASTVKRFVRDDLFTEE